MELAPVSPTDVEWLAAVVGDWDCSSRWSIDGVAASPGLVQGLLWNGVAAQRLVGTPAGEPAGLVQLVDVDLRNGVVQVALVLDPRHADTLAGPVAAFVSRVFRDFPIRKVLVTAPSDAATIGACLQPLGDVVARLPDQLRRSPTHFVDVLIYEVRP